MKIIIADTYEAISSKALEDLIAYTQSLSNPLVCAASGDSPKGLYKQLTATVEAKTLDVSNWHFLSLDEWAGMNGDDEGSCRFHLNNQLFEPLQVPLNQITFFDGRAADPEAECRRIEDSINKHGPIEVAIVGLGLNGHVGMNEPGTPAHLHSHVADIAETTQQVGQKYFKEGRPITHGLTLGIENLMEAKQVMLLVSGEKKASIVQKILTSGISEELPATLLRNHPGLSIYLDKAAASLINAGEVGAEKL
jgi:glucosamine-6-phosphate isomerase